MRRVLGATPTPPGGTAAWMRAARLGVVPATATPWLELIATRPVARPMRSDSGCPTDHDARHFGHQGQRGVQGAHGVVLIGDRIAEVEIHAVADDARGEAAEARRDGAHRLVIVAQRLQQVIGIDPLRQFGRADEIAEQHRHLPARSQHRRAACRQRGAALRAEAAARRRGGLAARTTHRQFAPHTRQVRRVVSYVSSARLRRTRTCAAPPVAHEDN